MSEINKSGLRIYKSLALPSLCVLSYIYKRRLGLYGKLFDSMIGMILGALGGAFVGELMAGNETSTSAKAAWGAFVGTIFATAVKLAVSGATTFFFVRELL